MVAMLKLEEKRGELGAGINKKLKAAAMPSKVVSLELVSHDVPGNGVVVCLQQQQEA